MHDAFIIKEVYGEATKLRDSFGDEVELPKCKSRSWTIWRRRARLENDEEFSKGQYYTAKLETRLADAVSKEIVLEFQVNTVSFKLKEAEVMAQEAEDGPGC